MAVATRTASFEVALTAVMNPSGGSIAEALGGSRNAVRRHLAAEISNDTQTQTGSAQTGDPSSNDTEAQIGAGGDPNLVAKSRSQCEPYPEVIVGKLELGLSAQRIFQDLVEDRWHH